MRSAVIAPVARRMCQQRLSTPIAIFIELEANRML
jgi:hypothetical protein